MKHAYLIIAHHEFNVLKRLLQMLDDERNDIFIHFDKKVKDIPVLQTDKSALHIIKKRINIRWGHISQIEGEYALMEAAMQTDNYKYCHIISGVHLPLYAQDYIHDFFDQLGNLQLLTPMPTYLDEIKNKMMSYNFFLYNFSGRRTYQILWRLGHRVQRLLKIQRHVGTVFKKASNWMSITDGAVRYMISIKEQVLRKYRYTMCGDEFFTPTELENSALRELVLYNERMLKFEIGRANARTFRLEDFDELMTSGCLFARKFSETDMDLVEKIVETIKDRK
ncbi:beta-1,6-N-acetylglucosaminyltransferase [Mucilaginibacter lappiensis]|uniref:Peptide O-xylosyltransferase n=1 Tax=Mucilaginibacter lappiensis TaxID=354630 RepID=A0A841JII8_9SPHI|nr:beta-1,6-N-acetylglucosaminyltransferase [Mucilaginibacter lappiensis]MBB6130757.1 hypothetical protein [Mucilaginibacter lappiensis]